MKKEFKPGLEFKSLSGQEHINSVLFIDQSAVGKTARSNPVTYLKVFDGIRQVMASTPEAKSLGYTPGTFSLNVDGGRCPVCKGLGVEVIDMMFMDDIEIPCDACDGKKYRPEILDIRFNRRNIADILKMTVQEAMDFLYLTRTFGDRSAFLRKWAWSTSNWAKVPTPSVGASLSD
ncbi:MAG: hypothetical protein R2827_01035 [Bdellovibrionales bacterium]